MKFKLPNRERLCPNHSRKLSQSLLELAEEIAPPHSEPKVFSAAVGLAVFIWNHVLLPEDKQGEAWFLLRQRMKTADKPELEAELSRLLELRRTRYGNDRRFVVDYSLEHEAKGPCLTVASLDQDRPEHREAGRSLFESKC